MAAVSQRIPNLLGGVSQQPDALKLPGQVRSAVNCLPDPTYGMTKRPGLKLVSQLSGATNTGRWFSIIRDQTERYVCQFLPDGTLKVWDGKTGASKTVNAIAPSAQAYIANVSRDDFAVLQINDYNFVLNRSKTVGTLGTKSAAQAPTAIVTLTQLGYDATYEVKIDGFTATHTTPTTGTLAIATIISDLRTKIQALDGGGKYSATIAANTLIVKRVNNADFTIEVAGGTTSAALTAYKNAVPDASRLPGVCQKNLVLKVSNLQSAEGDDYYVKFVTTDGGSVGSGIWEETVAPDTTLYIDPATMPHVVIRESNGTFTFRSLNEADKAGEDLYWVERRVGDSETNPFPTFVGAKITGLSFYKNRLVILSGSNVICSQPGSFFDFFRVSVLAQTDGDAIDLATGALRPVDLRHAIGDQLGLLIFSENAQFMLMANDDSFGPGTASLQPFTTFTNNPKVAPAESGQSIVFVDDHQGFSQVTEMLVTSADNRPSTADLSRTAPNFVPADLDPIVTSISGSLIAFLGNSDRDTVKIFKFFNNAGERVLASWVEWKLPGNCLLMSVDHDVLLFVTQQQNGICLSTCSTMTDLAGTATTIDGQPYEYRLDLFRSAPSMSYDSVNQITKVYFPAGSYDSTLSPTVVVNQTTTQTGLIYEDLTAANDGQWYVAIPGNITGAANVTLGYAFEASLTLPFMYAIRSASDGKAQADVINIPRIHRINIQTSDSGAFQARVTSLGRPDREYFFSNAIANLTLSDAAPLPQSVGNNIPVYARGDQAIVKIYSNTPFPLSFVACSWYGVYSNRGIRAI